MTEPTLLSTSDLAGEVPATAQNPLEARHILAITRHLNATRPWVRFLSVLGFVSGAILGVGGVGATAVGLIGLSHDAPAVGTAPPSVMLGLGLVYLLVGALSLLVAAHQHRYAKVIAEVDAVGGGDNIVLALERQKSLWKTLGLLAAIGIGAAAVTVVGAIGVFIVNTLQGAH